MSMTIHDRIIEIRAALASMRTEKTTLLEDNLINVGNNACEAWIELTREIEREQSIKPLLRDTGYLASLFVQRGIIHGQLLMMSEILGL